MPLRPKRLDNGIGNRFSTPLTLRTVAMRMAIHAPSVSIFLHKRGCGIKRITALSAEEMTSMPFRAASDDDLAFDWRFATFATRGEELMEVEVAVEAWRFINAIIILETRHVVCGGVGGEIRDVGAGKTGADAVDAFGVFVRRFRVEGYAFEVLSTLVAGEAFGMEAGA